MFRSQWWISKTYYIYIQSYCWRFFIYFLNDILVLCYKYRKKIFILYIMLFPFPMFFSRNTWFIYFTFKDSYFVIKIRKFPVCWRWFIYYRSTSTNADLSFRSSYSISTKCCSIFIIFGSYYPLSFNICYIFTCRNSPKCS